MTKTLGPITLTLDTRQQVTHSRVVLDDLSRRGRELSPRISEEDALRILLLDLAFDYLMAKKSSVD